METAARHAKVLIVDDEKLTRDGLLKCIPWQTLGIDTPETADDGVNGVQKARCFVPDIVLADVHMPRMDGIKMAFEIQKELPACAFVFLSGFSDKAYLKSAINLGAVDYIEKPVEVDEVITALKKAVDRFSQADAGKAKPAENEDMRTEDKRYYPEELAGQIEMVINEKFRCPDFSLDELSERLKVSKQHLCAVYKKMKHDTIANYISNKRIEWARDYFESFPCAKVKDVAAMAGFYDSNYFIKVFKRSVGITPAEFSRRDAR